MQRAAVFVSAVVLALMVGVPALAQSDTVEEVVGVVVADESAEAAAPEQEFATLGRLSVVPMASAELEEVKGQHVHFLDAKGKFHLAGNPDNKGIGEGNWYLNGSPDGQPVAPSYHGLCVAPPIVIPTGPAPSQCP